MNIATPFGVLVIGWRDVLEIGVVAWFIYRLLLLIQGTRALQIVSGIAILVIAYVVAALAKLTMISWLLGLFFTYGAFTAIVVFQPELRATLARLGQSRFIRPRRRALDRTEEALVAAVERLSRERKGALIAIERGIRLDDYVLRGTSLEARVSAELLATIFTPHTPLHDGAVVIRGDSIIGAGCILPLAEEPVAERGMGTRHRAALGLSRETDAFVIVVSEERGAITVANGGTLHRGVHADALRLLLADRRTPRDARAVSHAPAAR